MDVEFIYFFYFIYLSIFFMIVCMCVCMCVYRAREKKRRHEISRVGKSIGDVLTCSVLFCPVLSCPVDWKLENGEWRTRDGIVFVVRSSQLPD